MAADPIHTPLLLGLGLRQFSVGPRAIPVLKRMIRGLTVPECEALVERCLAASDTDEVERLLSETLSQLAATAK
jgi:phosphoenolpyruvate-protein kinase (PTS system EI component)